MNREEFEYARMFANALNCYVVDCVSIENLVVLIVKAKNVGRIVGFKGCIVKIFENMWGKRIKIVQYAEDPLLFIKNYFRDKCKIEKCNGGLCIFLPREKFGAHIAKNGVKATVLRKLLKKYWNIEKIKLKPADL